MNSPQKSNSERSLYDPKSPQQQEAREIEKLMKKHGLKGYYETEYSEIWGVVE